jgi:O-antigen/teichoic acid export membrane protein
MFGLIASYIPQVFGMILFPMVVRNHVLKQDSRWLVSGSMALSLVLVGAIAGMFYFVAEPLFRVLRAEYVGYAGMLPRYALAMGLFTVSTQTLNYALAQDDKRIVYATFVLALGQCVVFWYHHATMGGYVDTLLVFALVTCVVNAVLLWLPHGRAQRVAGPPSEDAVMEPQPE